MMIRTGLRQLAARAPPAVLPMSVVRPISVMAVTTGRRWMSSVNSKMKKGHNDTTNDQFSDRFDESDALEVGKSEQKDQDVSQSKQQKQEVAKRSQSPRYAGRMYKYRPPFSGFDDFLLSPFFRHNWDPYAAFRNDPFFFNDNFPSFPSPATSTVNPTSPWSLLGSSPGYKIQKGKDNVYQISIDVPEGLKKEDLNVDVVDNNFLRVRGESKMEEEGMISETSFDKRFFIGDIDTDKLQANFHDGRLVVKAPMKSEGVPVQITDEPHDDTNVVDSNYNDAFDESDFAEAGKTIEK